MQPNPEYLRKHFSSLSDEALLAVDRSDLVDVAQSLYDAELETRNLTLPNSPIDDGNGVEEEDKPDWLPDAAMVYAEAVRHASERDLARAAAGEKTVSAREALEAADIPCYLELAQVEEEQSSAHAHTHEWRLMVPGKLALYATSTLDRDIFNEDFEAEWRTHLEVLSDDDVLEMNPELVFCGLYDRIERVNRAYEEEIARRHLKPE